MRVHVIAVGRARAGPTATLFSDYAGRVPWPVTLHEVEAKAAAATERQAREETLLAARIPARAVLVALDPRGRVLSSEDFALRLGRWRDEGTADLAFLIGGADGLAESLRARAHLLLSFGPMIWPHLLARAMLAEQLFRAHTILTGHPYHRE